MSNRTKRNFRTHKAVAGATFSVVDIDVQSFFAIYAPGTAIEFSMGHDAPGATDVADIPANGSFSLDAGIAGPIKIRSTGADVEVSIVYA